MNLYKITFKPLFDFILALVIILIISPFLIIITILLFFYNSGDPFFIQPRPGHNGKIFKVIKFRTMRDTKDKDGQLLPDSQRLTTIGKYLRLLSVDELPQLVNILKGEMSFVGPRPLLIEYQILYNDFQQRRHEVLPGITGWAQINGRNAITWEDKFKHDVWYVDNLSFLLDIKILWYTIIKVIRREGIGIDGCKIGSIELGPFLGNQE